MLYDQKLSTYPSSSWSTKCCNSVHTILFARFSTEDPIMKGRRKKYEFI